MHRAARTPSVHRWSAATPQVSLLPLLLTTRIPPIVPPRSNSACQSGRTSVSDRYRQRSGTAHLLATRRIARSSGTIGARCRAVGRARRVYHERSRARLWPGGPPPSSRAVRRDYVVATRRSHALTVPTQTWVSDSIRYVAYRQSSQFNIFDSRNWCHEILFRRVPPQRGHRVGFVGAISHRVR